MHSNIHTPSNFILYYFVPTSNLIKMMWQRIKLCFLMHERGEVSYQNQTKYFTLQSNRTAYRSGLSSDTASIIFSYRPDRSKVTRAVCRKMEKKIDILCSSESLSIIISRSWAFLLEKCQWNVMWIFYVRCIRYIAYIIFNNQIENISEQSLLRQEGAEWPSPLQLLPTLLLSSSMLSSFSSPFSTYVSFFEKSSLKYYFLCRSSLLMSWRPTTRIR